MVKKRKSYKLRLSAKSRKNLDTFTGKFFAFIILLYVICYGVFKTKGFVFDTYDWTIAIIIISVWLVDGFKMFVESFARRSYRYAKEDLSKVTVVIACKDGEDVIEPTLKSLLKRFKPEQIIVASNGSTDHTVLIAQHYEVQVLDIRQPLGKVRAINRALKHVKSPYVLILDDDTLVERAKIPTGLLDEGFNAVAFRVLVKKSNWLTHIQNYEYIKSTDLGKSYHNGKASVQNISGAVGLFTIKELQRQISKHSGEFSGEDLQRTLLIHLAQYTSGVVLTDSTVYTQPPTNFKILFNQRVFSWYPGLYANFKNYCKIMTRDHMQMALRFDAFYNVCFVMLLDIFRLLSLPILIFYPYIFLATVGIYIFFETISYLKIKPDEKFWVVLVFPIYGLFNFITRICAFATFMYRRIAVYFGRKPFLDDYRSTKLLPKIASIFITLTFLSSILALNVFYF